MRLGGLRVLHAAVSVSSPKPRPFTPPIPEPMWPSCSPLQASPGTRGSRPYPPPPLPCPSPCLRCCRIPPHVSRKVARAVIINNMGNGAQGKTGCCAPTTAPDAEAAGNEDAAAEEPAEEAACEAAGEGVTCGGLHLTCVADGQHVNAVVETDPSSGG